MIESSVALSTLASAIAPPPPIAETVARATTPDQASSSAERSTGSFATRYFRFNLRYDPLDQQLYYVFKNPISGDVVDESPSVRSVRSPGSLRSPQITEQVVSAGAQSSGSGPASTGAAVSAGASAASSGPKSAAPAAPGASAAPSAPGASSGASSGGEQGRGSAIDSRI